jgi:hypothetical protein
MKNFLWLGLAGLLPLTFACSLVTEFNGPKDAVGDDAVEDDADAREDIETDDTPAACGNNVVDEGEDCDDGRNGDPDDGCTDECTFSCENAADCDDNEICNGDETCNLDTHTCGAGTPPPEGALCDEDPRSICIDEECRESVCGDGVVDYGGGEFCEPPNVGRCNENCQLRCTGPSDCNDNGLPCDGEEYCNSETELCDHQNVPPDGTVCGEDPRSICLDMTCRESLCGDSFTDPGNDEACDDGADGDDDDGCTDACAFTCQIATQAADCDDSLACTDDTCDESDHTCDHATSADTVVCRPAAGACDVAESCDGSATACPADAMVSSGTECRASTGACDAAETCDGSSAACPADSLLPVGAPCDDADACSMLDVCDGIGACAGTSTCTSSPITGTGTDTRLGICLTDADCDDAVGGAGCTTARPPNLKSSWTDWDTGVASPMTECTGYWAYTSPALTSGTEQCYAFYHDFTATWFYDGQGTPATCGADHCGRDACGYTP